MLAQIQRRNGKDLLKKPATKKAARSLKPPQVALMSKNGEQGYRSACTCTLSILSGSTGGSPRLMLSTNSMPETTWPTTV